MKEVLRLLPKVDELQKDPEIQVFEGNISSVRIVNIIRQEVDNIRQQILQNQLELTTRESLYQEIINICTKRLATEQKDMFRKVINATGIIIHTNLGRAPLSEYAVRKVTESATEYNNLEYGILEGKRRNRLNYVEKLLTDITGAEAALVVNNNAAAMLIVLNTMAANKEIIMSRGEMVEIGDSFRISEIIKTSGCLISEVGSTNRTYLKDYENAVTDQTALLLKVHTSNFALTGFTESVEGGDLAQMGHKKGIPTVEDMGSGILFDLSKFGLPYERQVQDAVKEGIDVITFSGDKMLGGPQAGLIVGKKEYIDEMKRNQLLRCLRMDKLRLAALEATLSLYLNETTLKKLPIISSIVASPAEIHQKALRLFEMLPKESSYFFEIRQRNAQYGGGAKPTENILSSAIAITSDKYTASQISQKLREQTIPVISVVESDVVYLDVRTVQEKDFEHIAIAFDFM